MNIHPLRTSKPLGKQIKVILFIMIAILFCVVARGQTIAQESMRINQIAWNPDGTELAIAGGKYTCSLDNLQDFALRVLIIATGQVEARYVGHVCPQVEVNWSPDGTKIAGSSVNGDPKIWDTATEQILLTAAFGWGSGIEMVWSPDGTQIASVGTGGYYGFVWNSTTGELIYKLPDHEKPTTSIVWNPDGTQLATSSIDHTVRVWDSGTQQQIFLLQHNVAAYWVAWSPDGSKIATVGDDGFVGIWNAQNGQLVRTMLGHTDTVWVLDWSPDGTRIATGGADQTIRTWDVASGQLLDTIVSDVGPILDLDWNPVSDQIAYIGSYTGAENDLPDTFEASDPLPPTATSLPTQVPTASPTPVVCDASVQSGLIRDEFAPDFDRRQTWQAVPQAFNNQCHFVHKISST